MKHGVSIKTIREQAVKDAPDLTEAEIEERATRLSRYYANNFGKAYREAALKAKSRG